MGFLPRQPREPARLHPRQYKGEPLHRFPRAADFARWLSDRHEQPEAVWLMFAKKASAHVTLSYEEAREQAIRFGWIDGLKNRYDDDFYLLRFSQRRSKSLWSKINRAIAEELIASGEMTPAGLRAIAAARADGRWERAYDSASTIEVPADFAALLATSKLASAFFPTIDKTNRFSILVAIQTAPTTKTRTKRMERFVAMLARHEVPHPTS